MKRFSKFKGRRIKEKAKYNEDDEIAQLSERISAETPDHGTQQTSNSQIKFGTFPLSSKTLNGLSASKFEISTDIQAATIPHALAGRDILGAAKTGSGKTLAFLIPLLEKLFRERWSMEDGLGALVIAPTRELALQIFDVLRRVGRHHGFSCGLVTGGKQELDFEKETIAKMNILVCTPGRLLQHCEETSGFDVSQLMVLVLDEADRILDLGFKTQLDSIIGYLPDDRQTMLFSATQTKSVKDLARLSLNNPVYLSVHEEDTETTPSQLIQNYISCKLHEKLDILYSFIKNHLKTKMIIFFSTCSQVRFVYEIIRSIQPGVSVLALHGKIKQERRTMIYNEYLRKDYACLFATDIAARGLDFPSVNWVIQADAPEDVAMYIHRVGRTARYHANGRALLFLMPQEEKTFLHALNDAKIPIKKLTVNTKKTFSVANKAAALLIAQPDYRLLAKKTFTGYLRSLQLLPPISISKTSKPTENTETKESNKSNFTTVIRAILPRDLPLREYAHALGLADTPPIPVVHNVKEIEEGDLNNAREEIREKKNVNRSLDKLKKQIKEAKEAKRKAKLNIIDPENPNTKEEELLTIKKVHDWAKTSQNPIETIEPSSKPKKMKLKINGKLCEVDAGTNKKKCFDDEGNIVENEKPKLKVISKEKIDEADVKSRMEQHLKEVKKRVEEGLKEDIAREKERIKEKKLREKLLRKSTTNQEEEKVVMLESSGLNEDESEDDEGFDNDNDDDQSGNDYSENSENFEEEESDVEEEFEVKGGNKGNKRKASGNEKMNELINKKSKKMKITENDEINEISLKEQEELAMKMLLS